MCVPGATSLTLYVKVSFIKDHGKVPAQFTTAITQCQRIELVNCGRVNYKHTHARTHARRGRGTLTRGREWPFRLQWGQTILRPGSHGCKTWLFVREALQFPWILQQNLEAAARSAEKREAARRAASRAAAAAAEKSAGCSACNVRRNVRSRSSLVFSFFLFFFFFFLEKRTFSANEDLLE